MGSPERHQDGGEDIEQSAWNAYGPFYSADAIERNGLDPDSLVEVVSTDGVKLYPQGQFREEAGQLRPYAEVTDIWTQHVRPAISDGLIDGWTALGLFFYRHDDGRSRADILTRPQTSEERDEAVRTIRRVISHLSH